MVTALRAVDSLFGQQHDVWAINTNARTWRTRDARAGERGRDRWAPAAGMGRRRETRSAEARTRAPVAYLIREQGFTLADALARGEAIAISQDPLEGLLGRPLALVDTDGSQP
jgi:hypothetical protein